MGALTRTCTTEGCDNEVAALRPYDHCTGDDCVTAWKAQRRSAMTLVMVPKVGERLVYRDDVTAIAAPNRHHPVPSLARPVLDPQRLAGPSQEAIIA